MEGSPLAPEGGTPNIVNKKIIKTLFTPIGIPPSGVKGLNMIQSSELILNPDGSVYHLNLLPENIAHDIIFVGDQNRVEKITQFFDSIEFSTQKREFKTQTGTLKGKRITVMSTGIGPDNIDIVLNELDALVNINLETRQPKTELTSLNIIRIGTSGSLQADIPVDSFVMSKFGLGLDNQPNS